MATYEFNVQIRKLNLQPIPGMRIRILTEAGADVTAQMFGAAIQYTDSFGVLRKSFESPPLPLGTYRLQASGLGYAPRELPPFHNWNGISGEVLFMLPPETAGVYTVDWPNRYVSPLVPVIIRVQNADGQINEIIQATVTHADGRSSILECQPDTNGIAEFSIHNRIRLKPQLSLVPDNVAWLLDLDFSQVITVELATVLDDNEALVIEDSEGVPMSSILLAANMFPPGDVNDLSDFVPALNKPAKWITPAGDILTAFRGYYADVMVWLPDAPIVLYNLKVSYFDSAGGLLDEEEIALPASSYVQRVKVDTSKDSLTSTAVYQVFDGETPKTEPLTVYFRG